MTLCHLLLFPSASVRLSGLALAFALKRITIVIINASLSASAVPQGLSGVTESDGGGNTWVNLD